MSASNQRWLCSSKLSAHLPIGVVFGEDHQVDQSPIVDLVLQVDDAQTLEGPKQVWCRQLPHSQLAYDWLHAQDHIFIGLIPGSACTAICVLPVTAETMSAGG